MPCIVSVENVLLEHTSTFTSLCLFPSPLALVSFYSAVDRGCLTWFNPLFGPSESNVIKILSGSIQTFSGSAVLL